MKKLVGRASSHAAFGGTGFQPVRRTGKMPVPPRTDGLTAVSVQPFHRTAGVALLYQDWIMPISAL
jgi:hypothetical protein